MKTSSSKTCILILLTVITLGKTTRSVLPQDLERITIESIAKNPSSFTGRAIRISGVLQVLKEDSHIYDESSKNQLDAWIVFEDGWKERSPKSAVKLLDKLRRKSGASWPYKGLSIIRLDPRRAYAELEGVFTPNPEYRNIDNSHIDSDDFKVITPQNSAHYLFRVQRLLSLSKKNPSVK